MNDLHITNSRERGFVLPVGMILLLVMTFVGVSALKDGALQERMASNFIDKENSFQSAENALRTVQRESLRASYGAISSLPGFYSVADNPVGGPNYSSINSISEWDTIGWAVSVATASTYGVAAQPRAVIEEIQNTSSLKRGKEVENKELAERYYRVTAFARGETNQARTSIQGVVVQK